MSERLHMEKNIHHLNTVIDLSNEFRTQNLEID